MNKSSTIIIPEKIKIQLCDGHSILKLENILIGIKTFPNQKNPIYLDPLLTDKNGCITIDKKEILEMANRCISCGIMDYASLESARTKIQFYFLGKDSIHRYIDHWKRVLHYDKPLSASRLIGTNNLDQNRENWRLFELSILEIYLKCYNLTTQQENDLTLLEDNWDVEIDERYYEVWKSWR
jgi:hypothetical protein